MDPQVLAFQFGVGAFVLERNLAYVTNDESFRPPNPGGNTMNWIVGHVVRTRNQALGLLGEKPPFDDEEFAVVHLEEEVKHQRQNHKSGSEEGSEQRSATDNAHRQQSQKKSPNQATHLLHLGIFGSISLLHANSFGRGFALGFLFDFGEPLNDFRNVLDGAEGRSIAAREHERCDHRGTAQLRRK